MPNLITRIPPGATIEIYNRLQVRQVKEVIRGRSHNGNGERWGAVAIIAMERAYPLRVAIRHWSLAGQSHFRGDDGPLKSADMMARGNYTEGGGKLHRQAPSKYTPPAQIGRSDVRCFMILKSPDHFPAPSGPRYLPDNYPGGVSIAIKEVSDPPNETNDAREVRFCARCMEEEPGEGSEFCEACEPKEVTSLCTHVEKGEHPRPCEAARKGKSPFCAGHQPKAAKTKAPKKPKAPAKPPKPDKIKIDVPADLKEELDSVG